MVIYDTPAAAIRKLAELGVSLEAVQAAIAEGHARRITCTENHAPFIPGTMAWAFTLSTLRDELRRIGWRKSDPGNFSLVINDKRRIQIVVESGDDATRVRHLSPRTKSLKGLYSEAAIIRNRMKDDLFPETLADDLKRAVQILEYPTWILLIHITEVTYRAELSHPITLENGNVLSWSERIFIPDKDEEGVARSRPAPAVAEPDIDVPVRRRKA